jgi:hypothetical protein
VGGWRRPRPDEPVTIDLDSTMCKTYGLFKQGGRKYTRKHHRGYHPLLGVVAGYDQVVAARLREGWPTTPAARARS